MAGSHYELDRDRLKRLQQERPTEKRCKRCGNVYPNTYDHFGKKVSGSRTTFDTLDVCRKCVSESHKQRWAERHAAEEAYRKAKR